MPVNSNILNLLTQRRSIYALNSKIALSHADVTSLVKSVVRIAPSAFNSQSSRVIILYGAEHTKVWDIVKAALRKVMKDDAAYAQSEQKVNGCFASGAGTVLFYEDQATVEGLQKSYPTYAAAFPSFSTESSAMAQLAVWTALAEQHIGATLQHYNELIEADLAAHLKVPQGWKLKAQMPFGGIAKPADAKTFIPDDTRFVVKGQ